MASFQPCWVCHGRYHCTSMEPDCGPRKGEELKRASPQGFLLLDSSLAFSFPWVLETSVGAGCLTHTVGGSHDLNCWPGEGGGRCLGNSFSRCWILFEPFTNILSVTNYNGCILRTLKNVVASEKHKRNADKIIHTSPNDALFVVGHWNPSAWSIQSMHRSESQAYFSIWQMSYYSANITIIVN